MNTIVLKLPKTRNGQQKEIEKSDFKKRFWIEMGKIAESGSRMK